MTRCWSTEQHPVNPAYGILIKSGKDPTALQTSSYEILRDRRESYKIAKNPKQNPMESLPILEKKL